MYSNLNPLEHGILILTHAALGNCCEGMHLSFLLSPCMCLSLGCENCQGGNDGDGDASGGGAVVMWWRRHFL